MDNEDWTKECRDLAYEYYNKYNLNPSVPMALIMIATGMARYPLGNNPFGIMGMSLLGTKEVKAYDTAIHWEYSSTIKLREYSSIKQCFEEFIEIMQEVFSEAWSVRQDARLVGRFLKTSFVSWSLDPEFIKKYNKLIKLY